MDWNQQTSQLMNAWTEAQKQMWANWMNMMPAQMGQMGQMFPMFGGSPFGGSPFGGSPFGGGLPWMQASANLPGWMDPGQWIKMTSDTWSGLRESTSQRVAGNMLGTPEMMNRSINLLLKAWQVAAPKIEAGQPWQPDLQGLVKQWTEELKGAPERASASAREFQELTRAMFEQWSPMTGPWLEMISQSLTSGHPAAAFLGGTQGLSQLLNVQEVFPMHGGLPGGLGGMPRGTVLREKMGKFLKVADTIADLRKVQSEYNRVMTDAMAKAVERSVDHLAKLAEKGEKITTVRDLMRVFFGVADRTLMENFATQEFLDLQERLTNALMAHKIAQREALEIIYNGLELPTRSEIDHSYKDIHDLKKEVRALRRQVRELTEATGKTPPKRAAARKSEPAAATAETGAGTSAGE